ncbi:hypothetical protein DEU37_2749 [Microbacterium sp. AG790]|uniref:DUF3885 domain-containing protein n=1 Tax=Microbacterium sp. AG790 TaxID=2183995 RepID=UPI000EABE59E|nr:hypothetical protein [Microbacterium sp. AG790]RKS85697.1 hypothetical protein DEU37_2749 [Microbacterium sp. AG790]
MKEMATTDRFAGGFDAPSADDDLATLTARWQALWARSEPTADGLRRAYPDRWVRFHTFPDGRRLADSSQDRWEVRRRQREVLTQIAGRSSTLVAIAEDWDERDGAAGWSAEALPCRRAWRKGRSGDIEGMAIPSFFWVDSSLGLQRRELLLDLAAAGTAHLLIAPPDLSALYAPYDGGIDTFMLEPSRRKAVREHFKGWLSARPDGL